MFREDRSEMQNMLYIGVDLHKKRSRAAVMDADGRLRSNIEIASSRNGGQQGAGPFPGPMKAVLETSHAWEPMNDWLDEVAEEATLTHQYLRPYRCLTTRSLAAVCSIGIARFVAS